MTTHNPFRNGDRVVFTQDDRDNVGGIEVRMPKGTKAVVTDHSADDSYTVIRVTLETGHRVSAWVDRLKLDAKKPTEQVVIRNVTELKVGDVVVRDDSTYAWPAVEREMEPAKPAPGTFGTAVVGGKRYKGFVSAMGRFYYPNQSGVQEAARTGDFTDFQPES